MPYEAFGDGGTSQERATVLDFGQWGSLVGKAWTRCGTARLVAPPAGGGPRDGTTDRLPGRGHGGVGVP